MARLINLLMLFLFLCSFGFSGGGYFLLFVMVPFEEWFVEIGKTQSQIDTTLKYFVYGWIVISVITTGVFYNSIIKKNRDILARIITIMMLANAGLVFYLFVNTDTVLVSLSRGDVQQSNERFTFGPYPTLEDMKQLKEDGYDGIITLLNPKIVFENKLLRNEIRNGEEIELPVYSFPMLPWIGENKNSIDGIMNLIKEDESKRYYIHCYLGKHRVDYIKRLVINTQEGNVDVQERVLDDNPDFERGMVFFHNQEQVIMGPYPTDEEWFSLLRKDIKEIVTLIDPQSRLYQKEKELAEQNGIIFTPVNNLGFSKEEIWKLAEYVQNSEHKIFVHSHYTDYRIRSLRLLLQKDIHPIKEDVLPETTSVIGEWIAVGDKTVDPTLLEQAGIDRTIGYGNSQSTGMDQFIEIKTGSIAELYQTARSIRNGSQRTYVSEFGTTDTKDKLIQILYGLEYGLPDTLEFIKLDDGEIEVVNRKQLLGPTLTKEEWEKYILQYGVERIVMVYAASLQSKDVFQHQRALAEEHQLSFVEIDMYEDYLEILMKELRANDKTTYIIVAEPLKDLVMDALFD
ncbi:hypothetical protein [Bacillus solimangrovi]|uniref:Uncharacterized protein n=1 Tax=Bacillus solimangrovi TaxID=1305675 RepID=A0A1E5LJN4_9BACI|nr:hypothetical protein [Bacillus solimangrovi]OEH94297.1 hypothetical protein BFG57_08555 [Bacillus solimangrovi]